MACGVSSTAARESNAASDSTKKTNRSIDSTRSPDRDVRSTPTIATEIDQRATGVASCDPSVSHSSLLNVPHHGSNFIDYVYVTFFRRAKIFIRYELLPKSINRYLEGRLSTVRVEAHPARVQLCRRVTYVHHHPRLDLVSIFSPLHPIKTPAGLSGSYFRTCQQARCSR